MRRFAFPIVLFVIAAGFYAYTNRGEPTPVVSNSTTVAANLSAAANANTNASNANSSVATNETVKSDTIPAKASLSVPFTSQAPFAVWDDAHNEGCEEASTLMVARFWLKQPITGPEDADHEILAIEKWETDHLGHWEDTNAVDTVKFIEGYWPNLTAEVKPLKSMDDAKAEIAHGFPVILPTNGRELNNPNFRDPGPRYHMVVIKGYDSKGFITNDSGTRRGENYRYSSATLLNAAHDWVEGHEVADGAKVMIVLRLK